MRPIDSSTEGRAIAEDPVPVTRRCQREPDQVDLLVGRRIQQRRQEIGLSQAEMARALGVRLRQLQRYEAGALRPRPVQLAAMAALLRLPIVQFFLETPLGGAAVVPLEPDTFAPGLRLAGGSAAESGSDRAGP